MVVDVVSNAGVAVAVLCSENTSGGQGKHRKTYYIGGVGWGK